MTLVSFTDSHHHFDTLRPFLAHVGSGFLQYTKKFHRRLAIGYRLSLLPCFRQKS